MISIFIQRIDDEKSEISLGKSHKYYNIHNKSYFLIDRVTKK